MLGYVGGPTRPEDITFDEKAILTGLNAAHYLRDRITVVNWVTCLASGKRIRGFAAQDVPQNPIKSFSPPRF
jgi:hypothetical protein